MGPIDSNPDRPRAHHIPSLSNPQIPHTQSYTLNAALPTTADLGPDATPFLRVFDGALSPPALNAMQESLSPTAPFWREHGYWRQDQGYFSYLLDLHSRDGPRLGIEAVIRKALFPLAIRAFPEVAQATTAGTSCVYMWMLMWVCRCRMYVSVRGAVPIQF